MRCRKRHTRQRWSCSIVCKQTQLSALQTKLPALKAARRLSYRLLAPRSLEFAVNDSEAGGRSSAAPHRPTPHPVVDEGRWPSRRCGEAYEYKLGDGRSCWLRRRASHRKCRVRRAGICRSQAYVVSRRGSPTTLDGQTDGTCPRHPAPHSEDGRDLYNFAKYESSVYSAPDAHPSEMTLEPALFHVTNRAKDAKTSIPTNARTTSMTKLAIAHQAPTRGGGRKQASADDRKRSPERERYDRRRSDVCRDGPGRG